MTVAIRAESLGKRYQLGRAIDPHRTLRDALVDTATGALRAAGSLVRRRPPGHDPQEFWALTDVSFEVGRGEAIGLIGGNGAGKSTLLKLLSRITAPTTGRAEIHGRVGSLLEVGTGFHPDLTGRENTFLNGAILGMRRAEVARKFDEIVAFAEVAQFIDTPVKRYSSGMYLRLAFAVAAHLEPEVLLVDEVLAVGDAAFQKKCLGKMHDVMELGRTVVFVSHNMSAVQSLCSRALWLRNGKAVADGPARQVVTQYLQAASTAVRESTWDDISTAPGNDQLRVRAARVSASARTVESAKDVITTRTPLTIEVEYWNLTPGARVGLTLRLFDHTGTLILATAARPAHVWGDGKLPVGLFRDRCHIPGDLLNASHYRVQLQAIRDDVEMLYDHDDLLQFEVADEREPGSTYFGDWDGAVRPLLDWQTELLGPVDPSSRSS